MAMGSSARAGSAAALAKSQPVPLKLATRNGRSLPYAWWGLGIGAASGVFVGHPLTMVVQHLQDTLWLPELFDPLDVIRHSFMLHMWPMITLYAVMGGLFGVVLGYIFQRLADQRRLLELTYHEFELQVATLRHHYKNLALGIRGFSERIKRKVAALDKQIAFLPACTSPECLEISEAVSTLKRNADILDDTSRRLTAILGQELSFLKVLTSETMVPETRDLYPLLASAIRELVTYRFREKPLQVEINGRPWEENQDSLRFPFEPRAMEIIIQNFLSNAMKYGDHIWLEVNQASEWVRIEIRDNGPGLEIEALQHRLLTTGDRPDRDSSQLGIKVSLHLIEKCGGHLTVWSEPGAGARFILEFPHHPPRAKNHPVRH